MAVAGGAGGASGNETLAALLAHNQALRERLEELYTMFRNSNEVQVQRMLVLQRGVSRIGNRPAQINRGFAVRAGRGNVAVTDDDDDEYPRLTARTLAYESTLSKCPRDLYQLWEEYAFGIEGRKAARKFTRQERGLNRYKYHRRKVVWDRIEALCRQGETYHTAADALYEIYGRNTSVTDIINRMRREKSGIGGGGNHANQRRQPA